MKAFNVILVFNKEEDKLLMCYRKKDPYKGLYNLVGGKIEDGEDFLESAYRELEEETAITNNDITLTHVMDFTYILYNFTLKVYAGKLNKDVKLVEEANKLYWRDINDNFFDMSVYAGEGNIGHMLENVLINRDKIFK